MRKTGDERFAKRRIGETAFTASPWTDGRRLFCLNEDGSTVVLDVSLESADGDAADDVKASGEKAGGEKPEGFRVVRVNRLNDTCLATPAIAGDRLFIRGLSQLVCIGRSDRPLETALCIESPQLPRRPD